MTHPLRIHFLDAFYNVTSQGKEQQPVFTYGKDRHRFLFYPNWPSVLRRSHEPCPPMTCGLHHHCEIFRIGFKNKVQG